ncbi:centromere protein J-like isoform X2 [Lytechinus variegatus]|uniref:centromere protein J-like isoform X2 n=1 Tax=Lytechinus variegatus TaxID=7654 RepID=UPI001BB2182D|nr:centromere protein J-like isoform X2 [Lytechinus variegatus]
MDNSLPESRRLMFGHTVPGSVMASSSRAGVVVDPMPLSGQTASLRTDITQDLLEQRGTQEQAKLLERFKLLRQWQQQQQNQLMLQQQQQLELLRNQQESVQQALMQQRLKQWGGVKVTNSPPKSPSRRGSPKKSPTPSPSRGTKVSSSVPKALAQAALTQPVSSQSGNLQGMENLDPLAMLFESSTHQEEGDMDSEMEHPSSMSVEGVFPLPDTASETSEAGNDDHHHDDLLERRITDVESRDDGMFRSASDFSMTPTSRSPRETHHLSIHLPDTGRTEENPPFHSPDNYPSSPAISPRLSPFTPTTPSHREKDRSTMEEKDGGLGREERAINSQLGVEFKSFEELVEMQIKADDRTLPTPTAASTASEQTTGRPRHAFLKRGEGISRFGMKPRKLKPRKKIPAQPGQGSVEATKAKGGESKVKSLTEDLGGKQRMKQPKKDENPKISRKISSKLPSHSQPGGQAPESVFKKPLPAPGQKLKTNKPVMSPVEREKVGVALQPRPVVPSLDLPYSSQSELDDTLEASFARRTKIWEKKSKIEQEDLDEFEMLEEAADDNVSFCSEASLVINVLQRAQRRKQELLGLSPLLKKTPLATLQSVDATEENNHESHDAPPDQSHDSTLTNRDPMKNIQRSNDGEIGFSGEHYNESIDGKVSDNRPSAVCKEKVAGGQLILNGGEAAEIQDDFYSSGEDSDEEMVNDSDDVVVGRALMRKVSKRSSEKNFLVENEVDTEEDEDEAGSGKGQEVIHIGRLDSSGDDDDGEEEEEDFDIYRTGMNENRNNNSNINLKHEMLLADERKPRTSSSAKAKNLHFEDSGEVHNGDVEEKLTTPDSFREDFEGTPRKSAASPEAVDQAEFEDEETWGDFTAQLSDSSDEDSIVALAPNLKSTPAKEERAGMRRKKSEKTTGEQVHLSPPPTSALVAKLFPKLRQPDDKHKQQIEKEEKVLHVKAERPAGDGAQARLLRDRLTQLENEIERFRKENLLLAKLREEREKGLESMKKEMEEFQKQKAEDLQRLQEYKEEEIKKLKRERKMFEKHQKNLRAMPDKRDREEIEMLKHQLSELQTELKQRESRWNASTRRLRDRTVALETENTELREEIRLLEQRRIASWKKEEMNKGKPVYAQPSSTAKARTPKVAENQAIEQSNNNNINRKRPGSEDRPIIRNGDGQHHHRGSGKSRTMSESSDDDDSENEYLQAYPAPRMEPSKQDDDIIYESQIANPRRSRSPSDRERPPIPVPNERTPPPTRTKPSSLSPSSPSTAQPSPQHLPHPRPRASPLRNGFNHAGAGVVGIHQDGGDEDEDDYEDVVHGDGKVEQVKPDGSRVLTFSNGTRKEISADGRTIIISFFNGDVKQILPDQRVVYYYSETKTTHTTYQDGLEILQFSNNQTEKHYPDGTKEITFPDQTIKYLFPNGGEESVFADGTVLRVDPNGRRVMEFPNGQREIHTDQYKRREYPDGTVKTVYPDGRQETRYSSGRIRIKDKTGNIVVDRKG